MSNNPRTLIATNFFLLFNNQKLPSTYSLIITIIGQVLQRDFFNSNDIGSSCCAAILAHFPVPLLGASPPLPYFLRSRQMERSLTDELYSEILKPKGGLSVPDITQSDLLDVEHEQWCEEESSRNDSDGKFNPSSDVGREWQRRKDQFHAIGYRDGIIAGKEASAQEGFNVGFKESVAVGLKLGLVRGVAGALNCLPGELREEIIESQETRDKFHDLYESVNNLSTTDALKLFSDVLSNKKVKQGDKVTQEEQNSDGSVLDSYYRQLESLIVESPAIDVQLRDKTIDVSSTSQDPSLE